MLKIHASLLHAAIAEAIFLSIKGSKGEMQRNTKCNIFKASNDASNFS